MPSELNRFWKHLAAFAVAERLMSDSVACPILQVYGIVIFPIPSTIKS
jgi:hypothetical protein